MHELGMAHELFEVITQNAEKNGLTKISKITIKLGKASGIEKDFLRHSLVEHIFPGTIAENAELVFIPEGIILKCRNCGQTVTDETSSKCPNCGKEQFDIVSGKDVFVESIEEK